MKAKINELIKLNVISKEDKNEPLFDNIAGAVYFNVFKLHSLYIRRGFYKSDNDNLLNVLLNRMTIENLEYFLKNYLNISVTELD